MGHLVALWICVIALWTHATPGHLYAQRPHVLAFRGDMGTEIPRGDIDRVFQGNIRGEFSLLATPSQICALPIYPVHFGIGFNWVSFPMEPGFPQEQWNYVGAFVVLGLTLKDWSPLPLYVEGRWVWRRLRPMEERDTTRFGTEDLRERPFWQRNGNGPEGVVGLELPMTSNVFMDVAARFADFQPAPVVLTTSQLSEPVTGGWTMGLQLGLLWFP